MAVMPVTKSIEPKRIMYPVGATLDLLVGGYEIPEKGGPSYLRGGIGTFSAFTGPPNSFKTTLLNYCITQVCNRVSHVEETGAFSYDTEDTYDEEHMLKGFPKNMKWADGNPFMKRLWIITSRVHRLGDAWFDDFKNWAKALTKSKKLYKIPFKDRDGKSYLKVPLPYASSIDSTTMFESNTANTKQGKLKIGDGKSRTMYMDKGFDIARLLGMIAPICVRSNILLGLTTHFGKDNDIGGNMMSQPEKKLATLKPGEKLKGASDMVIYLTWHIWKTNTAAKMTAKSDYKQAHFPATPEDKFNNITDIVRVNVLLARSKTSVDGTNTQIILSKTLGVQPELTEYYNIKETYSGFGIIDASSQYHQLAILPDVNISRTKIRMMIDENPKLRRALNMTSEIAQIISLERYTDKNQVCTMETLYDDLIAMGYDWTKILQTREWWTIDNDKIASVYLSNLDVLRLRTGDYVDRRLLKEGLKAPIQKKK